jgi:hypothetical protein
MACVVAIDAGRFNFSAYACVYAASRCRVSRAGFFCFRSSLVVFDITPQRIKRTADNSPDEALVILRELEAQARQEFVRGYLAALLSARLGGKTKATGYLKQGTSHTSTSILQPCQSVLCLTRSGPRFQSLAERSQ